uniref:Inositol polyphosphate-related phosphatase domain-containing protein n=1 Tax=Ditylenchus dipsaci TaxID=166011 RepID=A0A915DM36_9BILA
MKNVANRLGSNPREHNIAQTQKTNADGKLNVFVTTFNVAGSDSSEPFGKWFDFDRSHLPDLVVVGLQEIVELKAAKIARSVTEHRKQNWLKALHNALTKIDEHYKLVKHENLLGLLLVVYHRSSLDIKEVYANNIANGKMNILGNKGGVGISLTIEENLKICFINSHLAAGVEEKRDEARNKDAKRIEKELKFNEKHVQDHDIVFWMGDFNYRLSEEMQSNRDQVLQDCNNSTPDQNCLDILKHHDQLKKQKDAGNVFVGFHEGEIKFRPTYKFNRGTSAWDDSPKLRVPAWCDRILFKPLPNAKVDLVEGSYTSLEDISFSDHKPVKALFHVTKK